MKQRKALDVFLLCLKIILPILLLIPLIFFTYQLIDGRIWELSHIENREPCNPGMALYAIVTHIILLGINTVLLIISIIGLIIAKKYKASPIHKKNVRAFVWLTLAPITNQLLYLIITMIVMNIG